MEREYVFYIHTVGTLLCPVITYYLNVTTSIIYLLLKYTLLTFVPFRYQKFLWLCQCLEPLQTVQTIIPHSVLETFYKPFDLQSDLLIPFSWPKWVLMRECNVIFLCSDYPTHVKQNAGFINWFLSARLFVFSVYHQGASYLNQMLYFEHKSEHE